MDEDNELWELVRKRVFNEDPEENLANIEETIENNDVKEQEEINQIHEELAESFIPNLASISLFKEGIFAGFIYIFVIMIVLGILTIPGSITAAVGGFFGGRKAGDPARALTAAMLPFLIIAGLYFLASTGALPPGSGPNDVAEEIGDLIGHNPGEDNLGPISKMPDSNSSVFISVVTFAFIGGLVQTEKDNRPERKNTNQL
ncbi:MAG TPA: hypothetical protein EYM56_02225 [Candidatus Poseidoniales archaeon]|nr:hypothetical protein [Candidatus Poseidoniales archaeon]